MIIGKGHFERRRNKLLGETTWEGCGIDAEESLVQTGELLGDRRRLRMLMALVDDQAWPAGDLARHAGIQPATASYHLEQLVSGGLLTVVSQGRHRYYRLASSAVAELLEKLAAVTPPSPARSLRGSQQRNALQQGRTCYDHLAGQLGVAWMQTWVTNGWVQHAGKGYILTEEGVHWLVKFELTAPPGTFIPQHDIDWTERVPHFAGPLAKAMTQRLFAMGWIERGPIRRSVRMTLQGQVEFERMGLRIVQNSVSISPPS